MRSQTATACQRNWIQPKLALAVRISHMNVSRLISLIRVKVKPEATDAKYRGHLALDLLTQGGHHLTVNTQFYHVD